MAGKDWPDREGKDDPWKGVAWKRDGLWNLLEVRSRAIVAAALSTRSKISHPWEKEDWVVICSALNRVLSLCVQAEHTINRKSATNIPTFELHIVYAGSDGSDRVFTIPNVRRAPEAEKRRATLITEIITDAQDAVPAVTIRFRTTDKDQFDTFFDIIKDDFARQIRLSVDGLYQRPTLGERPPEGDAERQWDLRFRFCDFMRRFLSGLDVTGASAHPFTAFLLQPEYVAETPNHIPSGSFGYGYVLDEGQRKYVRERYSGTAETDLRTLDSSRVPCAGGQCGRVYLTGRATEAHDVDDARQDSPTDLQVVEKRILGDSVLLEIPVFGTRRMYTENAPDGPEFVLCLCLPKSDRPDKVLPARRIGNDDVAPSVVGQRVLAHTAPPHDALVLPAEAQVLCEMGQRLLSEYASAFGAANVQRQSLNTASTPRSSNVATPVSTAPTLRSAARFGMVGESRTLNEVLNKVDRIARTGFDVLIVGESGVGKELVARAIHTASARHGGPFVPVDCASLPQELVEEELFGHVEGAHSTARERKPGLFDAAHEGTLFLDEIGDMAPAAQAKVLRVLQEREVRPVGAVRSHAVDVRVIAATNQPRKIRKELFHRLADMEIRVPPLRERPDEIRSLANHFARPGRSFTDEALDLFAGYTWPGNIRQLRNIINRCCTLIDATQISVEDIVTRVSWPPPSEEELEDAAVRPNTSGGARGDIRPPSHEANTPAAQPRNEVISQLVSYLWSYPADGTPARSSWAVKESAVLKGEIGRAREEPGLGVAIVTTELAADIFGDLADDRITAAINWGAASAEPSEPYRILARDRRAVDDTSTSARPDLRHTFAWAVVLARSGRYPSLVASHLNLVLNAQDPEDGGWPAEDDAAARSELFAAIYAIEFLHLVEEGETVVVAELRRRISDAKMHGIRWLLRKREEYAGLWSSGVLQEFAWDRGHAAAWVLHRLGRTADCAVEGWRECLDNALQLMLQNARDHKTWLRSNENQRHRVEARIAAAARRSMTAAWASPASREFADLYLSAWAGRAQRWLTALDYERDMDVATAAFIIGGMVAPSDLPGISGSPAVALG